MAKNIGTNYSAESLINGHGLSSKMSWFGNSFRFDFFPICNATTPRILQLEMKIQKLWQESCLFFSPKKVPPKMVPFARSNTNNIHFNLF